MSLGSVQYNDSPAEVIRVFYNPDAGDLTAKLQEGYCLCIDNDAPANATDEAERRKLDTYVKKPDAGNETSLVGFVAASSAGHAGPGWIDMIRWEPGKVIKAFTDANMAEAVTILGPTAGSWALQVKTMNATVNAANVTAFRHAAKCLATETLDTDTNNAVARVLCI